MSTCPKHQWNLPCYTCTREANQESERRSRIWRFGNMRLLRERLFIPSPPPPTERIYVSVPEVDPATMKATGEMKPYGYVDLPSDLTRGQ